MCSKFYAFLDKYRFVYDPSRGIPRDTLHPQRKDPHIEPSFTRIPLQIENEVTNEEDVFLTEKGRPKRKCVQSEKNVPALSLRKQKKMKSCRKYEMPIKNFLVQQRDSETDSNVSSSDAPANKPRKDEHPKLSAKNTHSATQQIPLLQHRSEPSKPIAITASDHTLNQARPDACVSRSAHDADLAQQQTLQILMDMKKEISDLRKLTSNQQKLLEHRDSREPNFNQNMPNSTAPLQRFPQYTVPQAQLIFTT